MYLFSERADRRLDEVAHPRSAEVGGFPDQAVPDVVRLTVGDLCFFALGQITNRDFRPVQDENQQVFRITVPSLQPGLADSVKERAPRDLAELECDLVRDALTPDTFLRDAGALVRLRHYYPQTAPVALRLRLLAPFTDKGLGEVSDNYRDRLLYPGTITADQIELILARVETPISAATRSTIQTLKQRMLLRSNSENRERTLKAIEAVLKSSPQHHEKNSSLAKPLAAAIGSR